VKKKMLAALISTLINTLISQIHGTFAYYYYHWYPPYPLYPPYPPYPYYPYQQCWYDQWGNLICPSWGLVVGKLRFTTIIGIGIVLVPIWWIVAAYDAHKQAKRD
jgi:hypothetical protein